MDETAKITDYINLGRGLAWITDSVLIWDVDDDGQKGEAEDEDSSTSDTSILCIRDRDFLISIKANQPTKSQCFRMLLRVKCTSLYYL